MRFAVQRARRRATLLVAGCLAVSVIGCGDSDGSPGRPADVALQTMTGDLTSIAAEIEGRPLLVSMWAVWCQPCRRELPELERIADRGEGVDVLAVNVGDEPRRIDEFMTEMALDLPIAIDTVGDLLTALDVGTVPATVLFDVDGSVLWSHLGAVTAEEVDEALDRILSTS